MTNKAFLSECMLQSEKSVAYSASFASEPYAGSATCQFTISTSESQGFSWNQDIFASQYQQLCKVIYDGHVDSVDKLIQKITPPGNHEENVYMDVFETERGAEYGQRFGQAEASPSRRGSNFDEWRSRVSRELNKPRRRSEQSISFASDSKNGTYRAADVVVIDVEAATPENMHLKELLS
ncbi:AaceriAAR079Cp [[Ashbya] aceris (nom. inval.)]|nr:AaceriAAR079Cp [[Ashbya] aceris (nom. inval.)]